MEFESQAEVQAIERQVQRDLKRRNKLHKTWQPAVTTEPAAPPGRAVDTADPKEEGYGSAFLPDKRDDKFMDAVLNELYLGTNKLRILDMSDMMMMDHQIPRLADAIGDSVTLETLSISCNRITHLSMADFSSGALRCKNLRALDLSGNNIGKHGADHLARILKAKKGITALDVSCNLLSDYGALAILEAICSPDMKRLSISENGISDHSCAGISTLLDEAKDLEFLDISRNAFHEGGIKIMSDELVTHTSLKHLSLAHVHLSSDAVEPLAAALRRNVSLKTLDLYGCHIGDTGATHVGMAVAANRFLEILDLGTNGIHEDGCRFISDALTTNSSLTQLKLWGNEIREGVRRLENALIINDKITDLDVTGSLGPDEPIRIIKALVRKNRNAQFGLLRDQVELRILREENAKIREEKKKGVTGKLGKGVGMVTSMLQRGASEVAHAAGDLTDRSGNLMSKSGISSAARGIAGGVQETAGDLSSRAGSLARAAHLTEIAHGVSGAAGDISHRAHDIAHETHLDEIAHGVQGKFEDGFTSVRQGAQSVRPDSFKGGAMGDSAGSGAEWWNLGNITETLTQLPSTLQQAPNFFQGNPNTKPGSRQGVDGEGGVWGGV